MIVKWFLALFCFMLFNYGVAQVAPGVPPQRYQQAPPQQQQYQQHVPQHQVPVQTQQYQQQQAPQQQFQQPPPQQQFQQPPPPQQHVVPQPGAGHGHAHGHGAPQQLLHTGNIEHEKEHIAEHMDVPIDTSKMSEQELQFHYFKMHDADNNNKLDGCELIKSLIHWHEQGNKDPNNPNKIEEKVFKNEELMELIDPILKMDDLNNDGYIDYPEFIRAQQKAVQNTAQNQPQGQH